jgi:hypothetical protein
MFVIGLNNLFMPDLIVEKSSQGAYALLSQRLYSVEIIKKMTESIRASTKN